MKTTNLVLLLLLVAGKTAAALEGDPVAATDDLPPPAAAEDATVEAPPAVADAAPVAEAVPPADAAEATVAAAAAPAAPAAAGDDGFCIVGGMIRIPNLQPPANTEGFVNMDLNCGKLNGNFAKGEPVAYCQTPCAAGFIPDPNQGAPKFYCSRFGWQNDINRPGACVPNTVPTFPCSTYPNVPLPPPSPSRVWKCSYPPAVQTCVANCPAGKNGLYRLNCDVYTGQWQPYENECKRAIPAGNPGACTKMPPFKRPYNSYGFQEYACYNEAGGGMVWYVCPAECAPGHLGSPTARCDTATGYWFPTEGACRKAGPRKVLLFEQDVQL